MFGFLDTVPVATMGDEVARPRNNDLIQCMVADTERWLGYGGFRRWDPSLPQEEERKLKYCEMKESLPRLAMVIVSISPG